MFKVKHQNDVNDVALVCLMLTLNIFHTFSIVSIVDFEQINNNNHLVDEWSIAFI